MGSLRRLTLLAPLAALLLAGSARAETADGGTASSREDALFGDSAPTPAAATDGGSSSREDELFGGGSTLPDGGASTPGNPAPPDVNSETAKLTPIDENALQQRAEAANNKLVIGGLAYLRAQYDARQDYALHASPITTPNLFDIYFDGRPSDDLRAYVRARLIYNPSKTGIATNQLTSFGAPLGQQACTDLCPYLDQAWMKFNAYKKVFFTVGRQHIKWGAGRFWNPTDFLNQTKLNPLDVIDQRLGVNMIKIHFPIESKAWNFYGIVTADGVSAPDQLGYALRAEFAVGPAEITASAAYKPYTPLKLGADISMGLGDLDWHAEVGVQHPTGKNQIVTYGVNDPLSFATFPPTLPNVHDYDHAWLPQVVIGGEYPIKYSEQDSLILGLEYFYNSYGYPDAHLYPALILGPSVPGAPPITFNPLYNGQHYLAGYLSLPNPGNWNNTTFLGSWIGNLSDSSMVARIDWRQTVLTYLQVQAYAAYFCGAGGSSGFCNNSGEFHFWYKLPPNDTYKAAIQSGLLPASASPLANGLFVRATVFEVGVGLILTL